MSKKIASLYAEISADTTKLDKGLDKTKSSLGKTQNQLQTFIRGISTLGAGVAVFGGVWEKTMDLGKQGAELAYTSDKFDRLSKSIGTTSDLLLGDLKRATGGLRSDAELMASATDFMALGFAKTRDEAVRLTTVAGALNMDMNQLVLTLANKTTMRFDQLGVAVAGFDEKLAKLKATGMTTDAAFQEAFLQQAEEQINRVGNAADSAVAPFKRLDAATANLADTAKKRLAPFLADAAEAALTLITREDQLTQVFNEHSEEVKNNSASYRDYIVEMERAASVMNYKVVTAADGTIHVLNGVGVGAQEVTGRFNILTEAEYNAAAAGDAYAAMGSRYENAAGRMKTATDETTSALNNQKVAMDQVNASLSEVTKQQLFNIASANLNAEAALGLARDMGILNEESYGAYSIMQDLQTQYDTGKISAAEYAAQVAALGAAIAGLEDKTVTVTTNFVNNGGTYHTGDVIPEGQSTGNKPGQTKGYASGGSFMIPPGFPNDSYPLGPGVRAESGETVTVTPKGAAAGINFNAPVTIVANNPTEFMAQLGRMARQKSRAGAASIGA